MIVESSTSQVDTSMWPARHWSHWQLPRFTIEDEDRRRGRREERMRCCDEGMWTNGHPFIHPSGILVVAVTVSADGLLSAVDGQLSKDEFQQEIFMLEFKF